MSNLLDSEEAQMLVAQAQAEYPRIDKYLIEAFVIGYLQGQLKDEGEPEPVVEIVTEAEEVSQELGTLQMNERTADPEAS